MCKKIIITSLAILSLVAFHALQAQSWEIGFGAGAYNYKGDVAPFVDIRNTRPGVGIHARYNFSESFALRGNANLGWFTGDDALSTDPFYRERNFNFSTIVTEFNALAEYNFFDFRKQKKLQRFSPFLFGGVGVANFTITTGGNAPVAENNLILPTLPFGVGIKHIINDRLSINWEFRTSMTFSDKIDGVLDNQVEEKFQRVSRKDQDIFYHLGFSLHYKFIRIHCPKDTPSR
jgi:hypothetical protein